MVVVVEAFAGGQEGQPLQIARRIGIGPPAEVMSDGVHRRRTSEIEVHVHEGRQQPRHRAEQDHQERHAQTQTHQSPIEQDPVPPISRQILGVTPQSLGIVGLAAIQRHIGDLDAHPAQQHRRVRITIDIGERMMFTVHRHPLAGPNSGRDPHEHPKAPCCNGGEGQSPM